MKGKIFSALLALVLVLGLSLVTAAPAAAQGGIFVTPTSGLVTTEAAAGSDTFIIVLTSAPTASVTIGLSSSDTTEGTVSPANVIFTSANWNAAQTVTVTGVDDYVLDFNIAYTIITAPAVSDDPNYSGLDAADVSVTNNDNEEASTIIIILTAIDKIEAKLDVNGSFYNFVDDWFTAIKTAVDGIGSNVDAIKTEVTNIEAKLDNPTYGLAAIKAAIDAMASGLTGIKDEVHAIELKLDSPDFGLAAIKSAIDVIKTKTDAIDISGLETKIDTLPTMNSSAGSQTLAATASVTIVAQGTTPLLGTLSIRSTGTGYDVDVYTGADYGWITVVESGARNAPYPVSGFGLRIHNDTAYSRTVTYVVVYHQGP